MANEKVTIANGLLKLGRAPANGDLLIGNGEFFTLASLTAGAGISVTPGAGSLTIAYTGAGGTVTSVDASGGTTGLTFSGGPITSSGTLTMAGTLAVANGGTGQTTYTDGQLLIGNSSGNTLAKATLIAGDGITITNGSGTITVAADQTWTHIDKTADQTITSSDVLTNDSELQFSMLANTTYEIKICMVMEYDTGGWQFGITGPSSPTRVRAYNTVTSYGLIASGGTTGALIDLFVVCVANGANAGTFALQFCESAATGDVTMEKGSWLEYRAI